MHSDKKLLNRVYVSDFWLVRDRLEQWLNQSEMNKLEHLVETMQLVFVDLIKHPQAYCTGTHAPVYTSVHM